MLLEIVGTLYVLEMSVQLVAQIHVLLLAVVGVHLAFWVVR